MEEKQEKKNESYIYISNINEMLTKPVQVHNSIHQLTLVIDNQQFLTCTGGKNLGLRENEKTEENIKNKRKLPFSYPEWENPRGSSHVGFPRVEQKFGIKL